MPIRPRSGQRGVGAPEEVVVELLRARRLEGVHVAALGIDARHHVLDGAVLAGRVHAPGRSAAGPSDPARRASPASR